MTLQELCIEVIVNEFERYFLAFSNTDDVHLKRKFEFLQRVYSYEIASRLFECDKMQANYIDLLVNKYIKVLDTGWLKDVPWETIVAKFAEVGSKIRKMYFYNRTEEPWENIPPWQHFFHHLINVEVMNFGTGHDCTDEIIKCIAQFCHNIQEIDVSECFVSDEGIEYLCMKENGKPLCPKLKKVSFTDSWVSEIGVEYLIKNLRSLEVTDYSNIPQVLYSLHKNDFAALDKVQPYNLTSLELSCLFHLPNYTNILNLSLALCPRLKSLSYTVLKEEHINLISVPFELENLRIYFSNDSNLDVTNLLKLVGRKLTSLRLCYCSLSLLALSESCPSIKQLNLKRVFFKKDDIAPVFHHLEECVFEDSTSDFTTVKSISLLLKSSAKLTHITFKSCDLSPWVLKNEILKCCQCCAIKEVIFSASALYFDFARAILINCHSLAMLNIEYCGLSPEEEIELTILARILPNKPNVEFGKLLSESGSIVDDSYDSSSDSTVEVDDYDDLY